VCAVNGQRAHADDDLQMFFAVIIVASGRIIRRWAVVC
jgi:hypothetical protein